MTRLRTPELRQRPEPITALIDVSFFLLVFFLLVGRYDANAPFDVLPPQAFGWPHATAGGVTIAIAADGRIAVNGEETARADLAAALADLPQDAPLRLSPHRDAPLRHVLPVLAAIERDGRAPPSLIVTPDAR